MIKFDVKNQIIERNDNFSVIADSRNYLTAHFNLSEEWIGDVTAVFGFGGRFYNVVLDKDSTCVVPFEVIKTPEFSVSLFCDGEKLVTSNVETVKVGGSGMIEGEVPDTPVPTVWQQYINTMKKMVENGIPYIGDNGNWVLYSAEKGEYEDTGITARAVDGRTPVKGVDYWTEKDKSEIKSDLGTLVVNVTINPDRTVTGDKNVAEIVAAYKAGRTVIAVANNVVIFTLAGVDDTDSTIVTFTVTAMSSQPQLVLKCAENGWVLEFFEIATQKQIDTIGNNMELKEYKQANWENADYSGTRGMNQYPSMRCMVEYIEGAIGDIETSLDNIISKYGLGGDAE